MSIQSISPLDEVRQTSPLQQWASMLQDVPAPTTLQTPRLQPGNGDIMSQLGGLLQALMPLLQQLVMSLQQQQQPLLNSLAGAPQAAGPSPVGGASPVGGSSPFGGASPAGGSSPFGGPSSMPTGMPSPSPMAMPSAPPPVSMPSAPQPVSSPAPSAASPVAAPASPLPLSSTPAATSVREAAGRTQPAFMPVLRGDEQQKDSQIRTQADFGRAADQVAREYGLDPNLFRAQLQSESGAFTQDFRKAMQAEGDRDRASENNTSIGLGQISRKFLDGREWADGGPGNSRVGSQVVSTDQYMNSPTIQLRMAASNLAQRVADHGGLEQGLSYYVSGNPDPSNEHASKYLANIDRAMNDPAVVGVGR